MTDTVAIHLEREYSERTKQHKIEMENKQMSNEWKSCCLKMDKNAVRFFTQLAISMCIIGLCIAQLVRLKDCGSQHAYIGLLTLILGVWLPSPSMSK